MNRNILIFGIILLFPGLFALDSAVSLGPSSWALSQTAFWGTPIADFVFWIGLAHAGTFFSAILLVFGVRWQHRVALMAELSTLAALAVAASFPLIHLGIPEGFYQMIPLGNGRSIWVNPESPLVWDFVAILVYGLISSLYLLLHLFSLQKPSLEKFRRPFAWILFPLVLWVHTIVSMDFAVTFVPGWQGAYFPLYFIFGALYSGVALVLILTEISGHRVRAVEDILLSFSWAMLAFWIWEAMAKQVWQPEIILLGFLFPQLLWISKIREIPMMRVLAAISGLASLWWERLQLVQPDPLEWTWVDIGLASFSIGAFCVLFAILRIGVQKKFPKAFDENWLEILRERPAEFAVKKFRIAIGIGVLGASLFAIYFVCNVQGVPLVRMIPILFPIFALVAGVTLSFFAALELWNRKKVLFALGILCLWTAGLWDLFYRGTEVSYSEAFVSVQSETLDFGSSTMATRELWNARCSVCHGKDGNLNRKFVHEYYPLPQSLSLSHIDSLGEDSLQKVILEGRNYMQPFRGRVSKEEALALVRFLRTLAVQKDSGGVP